ncbi:HWE histidine kinase domain-containing protein [Methylobrevis albus]|uniref:histidine kinase n=1 Tax=Methylobrevis albus TaxID=2793297 RepID=A0A931MZE4_9HYPH|nr:HWE histidine kinase domain-containing protein [Methylobrevis albus]MBH0237969.1 PAS domain-containing protein [Methylobrevis albus]
MNMDDLYRLLRTGHVQAQGIVDTVTDPLLVLDESLNVVTASRSFFETFKVGRYETIGQPLNGLGNGQWDIPELRRLLLEVIPKTTAVIDYEVQHEFPALGKRTMLLTARMLHHPDSSSHSMLLSIVDATERHRRESSRDMLFNEIRHRMKNLLSVAQSIGRQTTTEGRTAEEYRDDFLGRFGALVAAHELAFARHDGTGLQQLLERVLAPYTVNSDAVVIEPGAVVELSSHQLTSLSMVLHELATNAVKYGALSAAGGQVRVRWEVAADSGDLTLSWIERGGPPVTAPTKKGFGTSLIHSTTAYNLGGEVRQEFAADGLETDIVVPLRNTSPSP